MRERSAFGRRLLWSAVSVALLVGGIGLGAPARAADGPAPGPSERRVLGDIHTDAVSTFWENDQLVLATKADVPEGLHTRFEADEVWFHVDEDALVEGLPAGFEFVAPAGSDVWLAPMTQAQDVIWPGFSTESVPAGVLDDNDVTFTLQDVDGPGDVELWLNGAFGGVGQRLWSSDEAVKSFTRKTNVHMHANWAFTEPGTYDLEVRADAAVAGSPVSDTATYTFVVGELPEDVDTATTLEASASELAVGDPVTLDAAVSPAGVEGYVEFRDGSTVLGHDQVVDAAAELTVPSLPVGTRQVTAVFVPVLENLANSSTSSPVAITVTEGDTAFGIAGIEESYDVGDTATATVVGHTPAEGETYRWVSRAVGKAQIYTFDAGSDAANGTGSFVVDMALDGYEIGVQVRSGRTTIAQTPWKTISAQSDVEPITGGFPNEPVYLGDDIEVQLEGGALAEGDSPRIGYRFGSSPWYPMDQATLVDDDTFVVRPQNRMTGAEWTVQVVRSGLVVAQSDPVSFDVKSREVLVEGLRSVYRVGQTVDLAATVAPEADGLIYRWESFEVVDGFLQITTLKEGTDAAALAIEVPATMERNGANLVFSVLRDYGTHIVTAGRWSSLITVSDSDPETQLLFFEDLGSHYHQGGAINLNLVADPALADGDTLTWEWKWPGSEWIAMPGTSGLSHRLTAEQALDGVQVRGTLTFAGDGAGLTAEPVTIHVDDHGAAPLQKVTVNGERAYASGDQVTLTAGVAPATVLDGFRWEKKAVGSDGFAVVEGASGPSLTFAADAADNGAAYRASLVKPDGTVAYGPSPAFALVVDDEPDPEPEPEPVPDLGDVADAYTLQLLEPTNGGVTANALGINDEGDVVGITRPTASAQPQQTVLWVGEDGALVPDELANLDGSQFSRGFDLNDDRTVVGEAFNSGGTSIPIRWRDGAAPEHLNMLNDAGTGILNDINDDGNSVGAASSRAVFVDADGSVSVLPEPDADVNGATVNSYTATTVTDGDVVGGRTSIAIPNGETTANRLFGVVWDDQGPRLLDAPGGGSAPVVAGVTPDGVAVGSATVAGKETPVLWAPGGTPHALPVPAVADYTHGAAKAIAEDVVVGYVAKFAGNASFGGAAVAWGSDGPVDLNTLVADLPEGVSLQAASDINEAGQIVGTAKTPDGNRGFILTPVAEQPGPVATTVAAAAVTQVYGKTAELRITVSPEAAGEVWVEAGAETLTGELMGSAAVVTLPAKALAPGRRTVAIGYSGAPGEFAPSSATATVTVEKATPSVVVEPVKRKVKRGTRATFAVEVTATGVTPSGRVTVKVAGKSVTAKLVKGRATVKVAIPERVKPGRAKVRVTYHGNTYVKAGKGVSRIRITR